MENAMGVEIERKFLVDTTLWRASAEGGTSLKQGYLARANGITVRVRCSSDTAWLTIKGRTVDIARPEFEYEIPLDDGTALLNLCPETARVEKYRYDEWVNGDHFVVDVFAGRNAGLVLAEIELSHAHQPFSRPTWLGAEVSHDPRYRNAELARNPFVNWPAKRESTTDVP